jgi:hypothetical protein
MAAVAAAHSGASSLPAGANSFQKMLELEKKCKVRFMWLIVFHLDSTSWFSDIGVNPLRSGTDMVALLSWRDGRRTRPLALVNYLIK